MTKRTIEIFMSEVYSKALKKNYTTKETDVYHNDVFWSLYVLNLRDYGP